MVLPDWPFGRPNPQSFPVLARAWDGRSKCWSGNVAWVSGGLQLRNVTQVVRRSYVGSGGAGFVEWLDLNWNSVCAEIDLALEYGILKEGSPGMMAGFRELWGSTLAESDSVALRELKPLELRLERSGQDLRAELLWEGCLQVGAVA